MFSELALSRVNSTFVIWKAKERHAKRVSKNAKGQHKSLKSQHCCITCKKSFKVKDSLEQHLREAKVHQEGNAFSSHIQAVQPPTSLQGLPVLARHCHSPEDLSRNKYVLSKCSEQDILGLGKCQTCGKLAKNSYGTQCYFHPGKSAMVVEAGKNQRRFTCCQTTAQGCSTAPHKYGNVQNADKYRVLDLSPEVSPQKLKSRAVVLDCEMAQVKNCRSEVILVCAVDYFTGQVLLNRLVEPDMEVRDWLTNIHGITTITVNKAKSQGHALLGWVEARAAVWNLIDRDTILIGHALQHDLDVLRMIHTRVVDSAILARNAVGKYSVQWGLQRLCRDLVGLEIRDNSGGFHDCLEDVLATREVVSSCILNKTEFDNWAETRRQEIVRREHAQKIRRQLAIHVAGLAELKAMEGRNYFGYAPGYWI